MIDPEKERDAKLFVDYWSGMPAAQPLRTAIDYLVYLVPELKEAREKLAALETKAQRWVSTDGRGYPHYHAAFVTAGEEVLRILNPKEGE